MKLRKVLQWLTDSVVTLLRYRQAEFDGYTIRKESQIEKAWIEKLLAEYNDLFED